MLPSFCTQNPQTIIRHRAGSKILRGSQVPDWNNELEPATIEGCSVQPASTSLSEDGRVLGITDGLTAYIPDGSDVIVGDRIEFEGGLYEIDGEPRIWRSATGLLNHIMLNLKRYTG